MATQTNSLLAVLAVGLLVGSGVTAAMGPVDLGLSTPGVDDDEPAGPLEAFDSQADFAAYVERGASFGYTGVAASSGTRVTAQRADVALEADGGADGGDAEPAPMPTGTPAPTLEVEDDASGEGGDGDRRVAGTNVQVTGIDEPDVVKTDGRHFFYAPRGRTPVIPLPEPMLRDDGGVREGADEPFPDRGPDWSPPRTHVVDTEDPANPELIARINVSGRMVRNGDHLVVLASHAIVGYDVSDAENPVRTWSRPLDSALVTARVVDDRLYLVTRTPARVGQPCPIEPVGPDARIACTDVLHPVEQISVDATYTALSIDPADGSVDDSTSFVGTYDSTVVYASADALYVTYTTRTNQIDLATDYVLEENNQVPGDVKDRLREIRSYDLSPRAEQIEVSATMERWLASLSDERRRAVQESLQRGIERYVEQRHRELTETGVVRIGIGDGDLSVDAVGTVPGQPLNQFSLDEHEGTLRIATTIPAASGVDSENDLYTLDAESLSIRGSVEGMSPGQRIYSVRYVDDTAYLVTFRQVDPFHVVDLSNPAAPREVGEVELPGFSDYLHPVGDGMILGVGQEEGQAKVTLFDATDPANPKVVDSQRLDAGWSAVSQSHHAFMRDARHEVVFLPAGQEGVVLSYANASLSVEKRVSLDGPAQRARYVDDYLYVFAPGEIRVLDETTWEEASSLELPA